MVTAQHASGLPITHEQAARAVSRGDCKAAGRDVPKYRKEQQRSFTGPS